MDLSLVITQLRTNVAALGGRVAGAADFARSMEGEVSMALPAAYVIPLDEDAEPNGDADGTGLNQIVRERIGVAVEFPNTNDRRGQLASSQYDVMRTLLWAALLNWRIDPARASRGLEYGGGRLLDLDRARLFYQWEFTLELTIGQEDGWQIDGSPLLQITTYFDVNGDGVTDLEVATALPQQITTETDAAIEAGTDPILASGETPTIAP